MPRIIIYICVLSFLISSCSNKFSVQKKRYSKGFYFSSASKKSSPIKNIKPEIQISRSEVQVELAQKNEKKAEQVTTQKLIELKEEKKPFLLLVAVTKNVKKSVLNPINYLSKKTFKKLNYTQQKKSIKKTPSDAFGCLDNILTGAYIIYILIAAAAFVWVLYEALPLNQFLIAMGICVLVLLLCYGVGSMVTGF